MQLSMWSHGGTPAEQEALRERVEAWNASQQESRVTVVQVPEGDYGHVVQTAITARELPDVVEVDGPLVSSYAYQGALRPLGGLVADDVVAGMLPSLVVQGSYDDQVYALGAFESGLGLWADRTALQRAGVRIPTGVDDAWTAEEFRAVLAALAMHDPDGLVLDLKLSYGTGEWFTYGFAPLLWSAGADLVDRDTGEAHGTLDSPAAVGAMRELAGWQAHVDPDPDGDAFTSRDVPLSWVGHWVHDDYAASLGDDLLLLPLPDMGNGSRSSQGSWAWAVSSTSPHPDEAAAVVEALVSAPSVTAFTDANGAVPGRQDQLGTDRRYDAGGPLQLFAESVRRTCGDDPDTRGCVAVTRPHTPGYPTLSHAFAAAVDATIRGEDPERALARAAGSIDADREANHDYAPTP